MREIEQYFCTNEKCEYYGLPNQGNISVRGKYGKDKSRDLLYCRTCGKRFAAAQASALFGLHLPAETIRQIIHHTSKGLSVRKIAILLEVDKDTVNRVLLRASEHCTNMLADLLASLEMNETQLNELLAFIKERKVLTRKRTRANAGDSGSGQNQNVG